MRAAYRKNSRAKNIDLTATNGVHVAVEYETRKLSSLLDMAASQRLVLPNFQREYVWSIDAQQRLVASVLTDVPVGSTLLLTGRRDDYAARRLGEVIDADAPPECHYLLDGQQRLSTLQAAFRSPFYCASPHRHWRDIWDAVPPKLRYSWTLRVKPNEVEEDLFGYWNLSFPEMTQVEPDQMASFLEPDRILVGQADSDEAWTHPAWTPATDRELVVARALQAMAQHRVPLWGIAGSVVAQSVTATALALIAGARRDELTATYRAGSADFRDRMFPHLLNVSPALPNSQRECSEAQIDGAFSDLAAAWKTAFMSFLETAVQRAVPAILLTREDLSRAVAIFEVINQGGTPLTAFDLVVAKNARDPAAPNLVQTLQDQLSAAEVNVDYPTEVGFSGSNTWTLESRGLLLDDGSLTSTFKNSFLNMLSILHATQHETIENDESGYTISDPTPWQILDVKHIKRSMIMKVPPRDIAERSNDAAMAIFRAWAFFQFRCGIRSESDLRYKLMVLPVAYVFALSPSTWDDPRQLDRLEYWYWTSLFGGAYRERQNENAVADIGLLAGWVISGESNPFVEREQRVLQVEGYSDISTLTLETPDASISSDVGRAVLQYTLSRSPLDFDPSSEERRLVAWGDEPLEDHHIVPLATAMTLKESAAELRTRSNHPLNSPMNRTFISRSANRAIGGLPPSTYLGQIPRTALVSHFLPAEVGDLELGEAAEDVWRRYIRRRAEGFRDALVAELGELR